MLSLCHLFAVLFRFLSCLVSAANVYLHGDLAIICHSRSKTQNNAFMPLQYVYWKLDS